MNKINKLLLNDIHCRDCIEGMKELPNNSIDLIVTSPPYNIGIDYGTAYEDTKPFQDYKSFIIKVLKEMHRIIKDDGLTAIVIGNQRNSGLPHYVYHWINQVGFTVIKEIFWYKGLYYIQGEYIFVCSKSGNYNKLYKENGFNDDGFYANGQFATVWNMRYKDGQSRKKLGHDAFFVKQIPLNFINISTKEGDIVLDPFSGVGTTAVASKETNRKYIGFEISQAYIDKANERLDKIKNKEELL